MIDLRKEIYSNIDDIDDSFKENLCKLILDNVNDHLTELSESIEEIDYGTKNSLINDIIDELFPMIITKNEIS